MSSINPQIDAERWIDEEFSDNYFGFGHQDKAEFAVWVNTCDHENGTGSGEDITAADVHHDFAQSTTSADFERFELVGVMHHEEGYICRPITVVYV